jgi:putative serine protease PepD
MSRMRQLLPLIAAAALLGAAAGAAVAVGVGNDHTSTVVREVTVESSQPAAASTTPLSVASIYKQDYRGVVEITVATQSASPFGDEQSGTQQGSGFVADGNGHVITNEHVVDGGSSITVTFWDGSKYPATLVGSDASTDVAVLKVDAPAAKLHPLTFADSSAVQVGDGVVAIGSPFGLEETVTSGIVSALHREMTAPNHFVIDDSIQTDAAINHGNSGGPLLDTRGRVIGVTSQIQSDSGGNEGVGFAVPSNTVRSIAARLISSGKVEHAYLGVSIDATAANGGVRLSDIVPNTPAASAGLHAGDVVRSVDGTRVATANALRAVIDQHKPGDTITLTYLRGGATHTAHVTLANRPAS